MGFPPDSPAHTDTNSIFSHHLSLPVPNIPAWFDRDRSVNAGGDAERIENPNYSMMHL